MEKCLLCKENEIMIKRKVCQPCFNITQNARRKAKVSYIRDYKQVIGCEECSYNKHPAALQLAHVGSSKTDRLKGGSAYDSSWSYKRIDEELARCRVLCANCHAVETYEDGYVNQYSNE